MISYLRYQLVGMVIAFVVITVVSASIINLVSQYNRYVLEGQPADEWFQYHALEFVEVDKNGRGGLGSLVMVSETTVHRQLELRFKDILFCERTPNSVAAARADDPEANIVPLLVFTSQNPDTSSFVAEPRPRRRSQWLYNADFPFGHDCVVRSTITGSVGGIEKRVEVETPLFRIEPNQ